MPRYFLNEFGLPEHEVDWVHELEVWSQRSGRLIGWIHTQNGDQWDAEVMRKCVPNPQYCRELIQVFS